MFRVIKGPVIVVFGLLIFITLMSLLIPSQIVTIRSVVVRLHQKNENDVKNIIAVNDVQEINAYQVQWTAVIKLKWYPWEKFAGIFIEKMTGSGYELTLESLKKYLENTSSES